MEIACRRLHEEGQAELVLIKADIGDSRVNGRLRWHRREQEADVERLARLGLIERQMLAPVRCAELTRGLSRRSHALQVWRDRATYRKADPVAEERPLCSS